MHLFAKSLLPLALAMAAAAGPASASPGPPPGSTVTRWVEQALQAVRLQNTPTPDAGRLYALTTVAMYDAVNGIDRARGRGRTHGLVPPTGAPVNGDRRIAAAAAAHAVLKAALRPDQPPVADGALDRALADEIATTDPGAAVDAGLEWGEKVGSQAIALRSNDGTQSGSPIAACSRFSDPFACEPGEFHAGFDARWRNMVPFGIADAAAYASPAPPALDGGDYTRDYDDVRTCGSNSAALDALCGDPTTPAERQEIARFWLVEARTVRETGIWLQAAHAIADQQGTVDSLSKTARLFALVGMSTADALKVTWAAKVDSFTWRPTTAIRRAEEDGNPATVADPAWTSRITTVGGSPEYTSGAATLAGAAAAVIDGFYCHKTVGFSFASDLAPNGPRSYASPHEAAVEAGRSRIFQGIHFQFSNDAGRLAGHGLGREIVSTRLQPIGGARGRSCA